MPQMSPMPWTFMLITMMIITLMYSSILYFSFNVSNFSMKLNDNKTIFNIWPNSKF